MPEKEREKTNPLPILPPSKRVDPSSIWTRRPIPDTMTQHDFLERTAPPIGRDPGIFRRSLRR